MGYGCMHERCERELEGFSGSAHECFRALYSRQPEVAANLLFGTIMRKIHMPNFGEYYSAMIRMRDNPVIGMELAAMSHFSDYCQDVGRKDNKVLQRDVDNLCEGLSLLAKGRTLPFRIKREVFEFITDMGGFVQEKTEQNRAAEISVEAIIGS
jgi:hypothetical protein